MFDENFLNKGPISDRHLFCAQSQLGIMELEVQSLITAREKKIEEIQMSLSDIQVSFSAPSLFCRKESNMTLQKKSMMQTFSPGTARVFYCVIPLSLLRTTPYFIHLLLHLSLDNVYETSHFHYSSYKRSFMVPSSVCLYFLHVYKTKICSWLHHVTEKTLRSVKSSVLKMWGNFKFQIYLCFDSHIRLGKGSCKGALGTLYI